MPKLQVSYTARICSQPAGRPGCKSVPNSLGPIRRRHVYSASVVVSCYLARISRQSSTLVVRGPIDDRRLNTTTGADRPRRRAEAAAGRADEPDGCPATRTPSASGHETLMDSKFRATTTDHWPLQLTICNSLPHAVAAAWQKLCVGFIDRDSVLVARRVRSGLGLRRSPCIDEWMNKWN